MKIVPPEYLGTRSILFVNAEAEESSELCETMVKSLGGKLVGVLRDKVKNLDLADIWLGIKDMCSKEMLVTDSEDDRDFEILKHLKGLKAAFIIGHQDPERIRRSISLIQSIVTLNPHAPIGLISGSLSTETYRTIKSETNTESIALLTPKDLERII